MERAEKFALICAILLLSAGFASSLYLKKVEKKTEEFLEEGYIEVNGINLGIDEIFKECSEKEISTFKGNYTGIPLSCIINMSGVENSDEHEYTIIGADGYSQTFSWEDIEKGILTKERKTIFPHLPGMKWVKDVVKIEVN
ncbi:MAG TPA: hypothetical protein ENI52_04180 [Thermoplasmata archaeon]|nr:hypothetical protein [Thermoplasmata archaeon]